MRRTTYTGRTHNVVVVEDPYAAIKELVTMQEIA
jgi:hypothetical protein